MASILDLIYTHSPIWAQSLLLSAYGLRLRRLRFGSSYRKELKFLLESQHFTKTELDKVQAIRLKTILSAALDAPYYQQFRKDINIERIKPQDLPSALPLLSKDTARSDPTRFFVQRTSDQKSITIYTSGTSGSPLPVKTRSDIIQKNYAFFSRYLNWHGVAPRDHGVTFAGRLIVPASQQHPPFWRRNLAMDTLLCSSYHLSEKWIPQYVAALSNYKPNFIDSYPSAIANIASFINRHQISHSIRPKVVITSSETLLEHQRNEIENAFQCPVRDHYGCAEMAALITECEFGKYHVNPEFGIVEIVRDNGTTCDVGEPGNICCTGFLNASMPLVRYMIGDRAALSDEKCNCGRAFPVINQLLGRMDDVVLTPDGRRVGRLDPAFKGDLGIIEAQIVQTTRNEIDVLIVTDQKFSSEAGKKLRQDLQQRLSVQMTINIKQVSSIAREKNGKFRAVISKVRD